MYSSLIFRFWYSLNSMNATFKLEATKNFFSRNHCDHFFVSAHIAIRNRQHFDFPVIATGVMHIAAKEFFSKKAGLIATSTCYRKLRGVFSFFEA